MPIQDDGKEKYSQNNQKDNVEEDQRDLVDKSSNNKSVKQRLFRHIC